MVFRLFMGILQMGIDASVVIVLVLLTRMLLGKAPKKYAYFLWIIVGIQLVCPVKIASPFSVYNLLPQSSDRMEQSLEKYTGVSWQNVRMTGKKSSQKKSTSDDQNKAQTDTVPNDGQTDQMGSTDSSAKIQIKNRKISTIICPVIWQRKHLQTKRKHSLRCCFGGYYTERHISGW